MTMQERNYPEAAQAMGNLMTKSAYREDVTVSENIDAKIRMHQEAIKELEQARTQLTPLLEIRIDLLRKAMML
jgi:ABC-type transporter Mla maintaining outer membrane lipid asymmetry ATPase subunit MlaF